jgi:archaemetzincin
MKWLGLIVVFSLSVACGGADPPAANVTASTAEDRVAAVARMREPLTPFFIPMAVREGDWLESQPENGETFEEYVRSNPTLPTPDRKIIYIQPVGAFSPKQVRVIQQTADYMRAFYNLPVVLRDVRPIDGVTPEMVRVQHPNNLQIQTTYFLDDLLPKMLPADAAALICFTSNDLYPGGTWNFVFGQASLEKRVGVWSLWRLERNGRDMADDDLFLDRTLKVGMHETGHMFSMRHCTKYECLMSGTMHLDETDRRPLDTCPECTMKIAWAMKYPLDERYDKLAAFWRGQRRTDEQSRMLQKGKAVAAAAGK